MALAILCVGVVFLIFSLLGGILLTHFGKLKVDDGQELEGHLMSAVGWVLLILFTLSVLGLMFIFFVAPIMSAEWM